MRLLQLLFLFLCCALTAAGDTLSVYFPFNSSALPYAASHNLDSAIYHGLLSDRQPVRIIGYTDEIGADAFNLRLSQRRAESVRDYLVLSGFRESRITLITGRGEAAARPAPGPDGHPADRRVDIVSDVAPSSPAPKIVAPAKATSGPARKASETNLSEVAPGESLVLDKIYFFPGRHVVRPESDAALDTLFHSLIANPDVKIVIEGHVCCIPSFADDALDEGTRSMNLSVNRAKAIREYLIDRGIDSKRLSFQGFGRRRPIIDPETNEAEANINRRVEIRVLK